MKLMIIDGNSILNRAFYGIRALSAPDGTPTNAVYGFLTMYKRFLAELQPDAVAVSFDLKAPTFRHLYYPQYKAQRKPMSEELAVQIPLIKQVLDYMNIKRLEIEGFEADDILGTVSLRNENAGWDTIVVTGDRDSLQLVSEKTQVYLVKGSANRNENILYTPDIFRNEYGFDPQRIIDLKALMGDASDNIPGVKGIGEKTALSLIQRFANLENLYENIDSGDISDKIRTKLVADKEHAALSFYLATINRDIPIDFNPEDALINEKYDPQLYSFFMKLGFNRFIEEWHIPAELASGPACSEQGCEPLEATDANFAEISKMIENSELLCVLSDYPDEDLFIRGDTSYHICRTGCFLTYDSILDSVFNGKKQLVGHQVKALIRKLLDLNLNGTGFIFDTSIAAYLLDPNSGKYDLPFISEKYLGKNANDINALYSLHQVLAEKLKEKDLVRLFYEIEMPLCEILAKMESNGFPVSKKSISDFDTFLDAEINRLQSSIYSYSGYEFNINSTKQLGTFLFDELRLPYGKKTKTGWSTNSDVLDKLSSKHPVIEEIKQYRTCSKLKSTYAEGLLKQIDPDGKIRTTFQMTATSTGRLSSTDPNLQNIPVRTEIGAKLREMFLPSDGYILVDADYSQIELRILASVSEDEGMIAAFNNNADFHAATASDIFGVPLAQVTPKMRSSVKAINFGIIYGMSAFSLSQDLKVSVEEAKGFIDAYYSRYPDVKAYLDGAVRSAKDLGYAKTMFGRIREIPELKSANFNLRSFGERVAYNMPIQGTAADIMKIAMIRVYRRLKDEKLKTRILLQVHDELIVEAPFDETEAAKAILKEEMERAASLPVKLKVEVNTGINWGEAH